MFYLFVFCFVMQLCSVGCSSIGCQFTPFTTHATIIVKCLSLKLCFLISFPVDSPLTEDWHWRRSLVLEYQYGKLDKDWTTFMIFCRRQYCRQILKLENLLPSLFLVLVAIIMVSKLVQGAILNYPKMSNPIMSNPIMSEHLDLCPRISKM